MIIKSSYVNVIKAKVCPACGAMVKWKRKDSRSGGQIRTAFEDDTPELVPLDQYNQGGATVTRPTPFSRQVEDLRSDIGP